MNKYLDRYIPIVTLLLGCGEVANHSSAFNLRGGTEGFEYLVCGVAGHAHHEPSTRLSIAHDVLKMMWNVLIKQKKNTKEEKKKCEKEEDRKKKERYLIIDYVIEEPLVIVHGPTRNDLSHGEVLGPFDEGNRIEVHIHREGT